MAVNAWKTLFMPAEKHKDSHDDDECVGSCFTCIPDCPRHPSKTKAAMKRAPSPSPLLPDKGSKPAVKNPQKKPGVDSK